MATEGRRRGFTLLELVIVLALCAVLGALGTPSFGGLIARQRLQSAGYHLKSDIALARREAGRRGQTVLLSFQPGEHWCYALSTGVAADCRRSVPAQDIGLIKVVHAAEHPGITLLQADAMALDARTGGSLQAIGHARFATREGQQLQLTLSTMGRTKLCAPAAPLAGLPACSGAAGLPDA